MNPPGFDFGKNWQHFLAYYLSRERLEKAKTSLLEFCGGNRIQGKSFVDAGSGSGLFSWAAMDLGAERVVSFDINPKSVDCTRRLRAENGSPKHWVVLEGSALDPRFLDGLGQFDFVYSWGVLHHTGEMWEALRNVCGLCRPEGIFYLALYNKADIWGFYPCGRFGTSDFWKKEKAFYNSLSPWVQEAVDSFAMTCAILLYLLTFQNPVKKIRGHQELRGMSWRVDLKDWLGGYPYEAASAAEVFQWMKAQGFLLENLKSNNGLLNNEYLFKKQIRHPSPL